MFTARFYLLCLGLVALLATGGMGQTDSRNSNVKLRPTPSPLAAKVGSAVNWRTSFAEAQRLSEQTGKPIFWYVPTIQNTFMDRKTEIDRYMRAGLFSWPSVIEALNERFIPLVAIPNGVAAATFELVPYKFIEPGFLVISPSQQVTVRCDRLTTQHPYWLRSIIDAAGEHDHAKRVQDRPLDVVWKMFRQAQYRQVSRYVDMLKIDDPQAVPASAELELLRGMCQFRLGDQATAKETWRVASLAFPNDPLAWKAAAEAEGIGPFVRGFEVHRELPRAAYDPIDLMTLSSAAPPATYDQPELWRRGIKFLLGMQRDDGAFVDCDYDFGGSDSLPNVHVAITAICGMALMEADARKVNVLQRQRRNAAELARQFVLDDSNWNPNDSDELFWAHVHRVRFLATSVRSGWDGADALQSAVVGLQQMQSPSGSWFHEYKNPLVTALALVSLKEAEEAGARVDQTCVQQGIASLQGNRGRGGFFYSDATYAPPAIRQQDQTDASAGRLPLCELALRRWGATDEQALANAIRVAFDKQSHLLAALKYDDHTSRHAYGGFFFWFDLLGRADAVAAIENDQQRELNQQRIRELVLALPEIDGCFVDSHEIGRCYGTAMALLCLARTDQN